MIYLFGFTQDEYTAAEQTTRAAFRSWSRGHTQISDVLRLLLTKAQEEFSDDYSAAHRAYWWLGEAWQAAVLIGPDTARFVEEARDLAFTTVMRRVRV